MAIYLISFGISCFFIKISETFKKNKKICFLLVIIGLLIPCLLAGMRNYKVGTDVNEYVKPMFNSALNSNGYNDYLSKHWYGYRNKVRSVDEFEIGFRFLIYFVAKITANLQVLLFIIQLIIVLPIYYGLKKFKSLDNKVWFGMLVFYFMFYNITLNAIRQFMVVSIMFWASSSLINDKNNRGKLRFFISLIISVFIHTSALLAILLYLIYLFINRENKNTKVIRLSQYVIPLNKVLTYAIIILGTIIIMNSSVLVKLLNVLNLESYSNYIEGEVTFVKSSLLKILPILILLILVGKDFVKRYKNAYFLILMFAIDCLLTQFGSVSTYAGRIGYMFAVFNVAFFTKLANSNKNRSTSILINVALVVYMLFYWYYNFAVIGRGATVPYIFYKK